MCRAKNEPGSSLIGGKQVTKLIGIAQAGISQIDVVGASYGASQKALVRRSVLLALACSWAVRSRLTSTLPYSFHSYLLMCLRFGTLEEALGVCWLRSLPCNSAWQRAQSTGLSGDPCPWNFLNLLKALACFGSSDDMSNTNWNFGVNMFTGMVLGNGS